MGGIVAGLHISVIACYPAVPALEINRDTEPGATNLAPFAGAKLMQVMRSDMSSQQRPSLSWQNV